MAQRMQAMQLDRPGAPLRPVRRLLPVPNSDELLIQVSACGVCRTDLHVCDGDIHGPLPIIPGHEIVGHVLSLGAEASGFAIGDRVGVPWLGRTCGRCSYCLSGRENLCDSPTFTGFTADGGFATHCIACANFCFEIPEIFGDVEAAPLLCAGLIGYRCYRMAGQAERIGIYGFGAAAHIMVQLARHQARRVFAFVRPGDEAARGFALSLGCEWAGGSNQPAPEPLDAAIIFAPAGELVPQALRQVRKGGRVVCGGIHMSDIPSFPYADLWGERSILSVANLTRSDGVEFLALAAEVPVRSVTTRFALDQANTALRRLREGRLEGAAVLVP